MTCAVKITAYVSRPQYCEPARTSECLFSRSRKEPFFVTDVNIGASSTDSRAALNALRLPELLALANERGIAGASKLRKGELVDAISADNDDNNSNTGAEQEQANEAAPVEAAPVEA